MHRHTTTDSDFAEAFATALEDTERSSYLVVWADSLAPVTPLAPIPGALGVAADTTRTYGERFTARKQRETTLERAHSFAQFLEDSERRAREREQQLRERKRERMEAAAAAAANGRERADMLRAALNNAKRAQREAREADSLEDRHHAIMRAWRGYARMEAN